MTVLDEPRDAVTALCRAVLAEQFADAESRLNRPPAEWFALLSDFPMLAAGDIAPIAPRQAAAVAELRLARAAVEGVWPPGGLERFVLLQAMLVAAPRIGSLALGPSARRMLAETFARFARPQPHFSSFFDLDGWRFQEMAQLVTLRAFPAGQHDWWVDGVPRTVALRTHPLALPRLLSTLAAMGGRLPLARFRLNFWRPNPLVLLKSEAERSYWRIAQAMELRPELRGLMAYSWFYAPEVGRVTPHLAWMRDLFAEQGAYLGEMEHAPAESGYLTGSAKRRKLHEDGRFHPRVTLVLWPRRSLLAWAAGRPDLAEV